MLQKEEVMNDPVPTTGARRPGRPRNSDRTPAHVAAAPSIREPEHAPNHTRARTRQRHSDTNQDMFYIPVEEIPEGSSYEWKRFSVHGQQDPFYLAQMREQGWEPVDPKRHPNWLPPGYSEPSIIKHGMILMERPIELTREAQSETRAAATKQIIEAEQRLGLAPKDTMTRDHREVQPRVVKEIGRMIPAPIEE